ESPSEERGALEQRSEGGGSLLEVLPEMLRLGAPSTRDQRGVRAIPALDDPDVHLRRPGGHAVEGRLRDLAQPAAARCIAVRDETRGRARGVENPEGAGGSRCELHEQDE